MASSELLTICIIQPSDPRGKKIGGIESHIRDMIRSAPPDVTIFLIAIDEVGDLELNKVQTAYFEDRPFTILPLLARTGEDHLHAARSLSKSLTLNFFLAFLRNIRTCRRALGNRLVSAEIQRFEFAAFGKLLGIPTVQIVHGEGSRDQPMDSLLKRYWFTHQLNEYLAFRVATRIIGVNPRIVDRIRAHFPFAISKSEMMTVSVNTDVFALSPRFPASEPFRIGFAGRLDAFKRPDIMFRICACLKQQGMPIEFHYIGDGDTSRFPEFESIRSIAVLHGTQSAHGVAQILAQLHAGILVSEFEGMPVYVLELLSTGRPLVALDLPQLKLVVENGVSGQLVERTGDLECDIASMAHCYKTLKIAIENGKYNPAEIRDKVTPFSHHVQKAKLLNIHRLIAVGTK